MKTIADILELYDVARQRNQGIGYAMSPEGPTFMRRMELLVGIVWSELCDNRTDELKKKEEFKYPPFEEMCRSLEKVDQTTPLSLNAKAAFLYAFCTLLESTDNELEGYHFVKMHMKSGLLVA